MIVTIDGPAGAGKSTLSRQLAAELGYVFLDTGAMYRAIALKAARLGIDWEAPQDLAEMATRTSISFEVDRVLLDGEDVTTDIRTPQVTAVTRHAANNVRVREHLVSLQRQFAQGRNLVTEGRDQGSLVFPDAECKIFLTASPEERARRRVRDLEERGEKIGWEEVLAQQTRRDLEDQQREYGGLRQGEDAVTLLTDGLTPQQVLARMLEIVRSRQTPA
ncbi:MAG: (d)CMP kinase [Pirellulaceae bacterium]